MTIEQRADFESSSRSTSEVSHSHESVEWTYCANSFWLAVENEDDAMSPWLRSDGFWESWVSIWVIRNMPSYKNFIDVGSNIGYFSMLAAKLGANVVAIDPNFKVLELLRKSVIRNGMEQKVTVIAGAVGNKSEVMALDIPLRHSGGGHVVAAGGSNQNITFVSTIDAITERLGLNLDETIIKIDAEGFEFEIIQGAMSALRQSRSCILIIEWDASRFTDWENQIAMLRKNFDIYLIDGAGEEVSADNQTLENCGLQMLALRSNQTD